MSNPDFGDFDPDDAYDHEPPDPEQVAYRLHLLREEIDHLGGGTNVQNWDGLSPGEQTLARAIATQLVYWLLTHNPEPEEAAESLHNVRRFLNPSALPAWDDLNEDDKSIGIHLMTLIINWLRRQGALA